MVFDDWRFEVIEMEGRRLAAILASIEGHKCRNWVTNSIFSGERPIATNVVGGTDR